MPKDTTDGVDLADILIDISKEHGLIYEVIGSFIDFLMRNKNITYAEMVSAISYARQEWDV